MIVISIAQKWLCWCVDCWHQMLKRKNIGWLGWIFVWPEGRAESLSVWGMKNMWRTRCCCQPVRNASFQHKRNKRWCKICNFKWWKRERCWISYIFVLWRMWMFSEWLQRPYSCIWCLTRSRTKQRKIFNTFQFHMYLIAIETLKSYIRKDDYY